MKKIFYLIAIFAVNLSFGQDNSSVVKSYLQNNTSKYSLENKDVSDISITSQLFSKSMKADVIYVEQTYKGTPIYNSSSPVILKNGVVTTANLSFVSKIAEKVNTTAPAISASAAVSKAASQLGIQNPSSLNLIETISAKSFVYSNGGISLENIPVKLMYFRTENNTLRLVWDLSIYLKDGSHYYSARVDAVTGALLNTVDWVTTCNLPAANHPHNRAENSGSVLFNNSTATARPSMVDAQYRVFALPLRNPNDGPETLEVSPEDAIASPFGWHDTDGVEGAEFTITRGNNVYAYLDLCNLGSGDSPDGGAALNFDFPYNLPNSPADFKNAATVNLFYLNNVIHDVTFQYGFDDISGNFQEINYSGAPGGGDSVNAEAQDGGGTNNANFGTGPDGGNPRMQMYLWTGASAAVADVFTITAGPLAGGYTGFPASFGGAIKDLTADLAVIMDDDAGASVDPNDGCDGVTNAGDLAGKIAIIRRGGCEFGFKALAAENAGAIGAIIVNNIAGPPVGMAGGEVGCQVTIPTLMVSDVDGEALIAELLGGGSASGTLDGTNVPVNRDGSLDTEIVVHEYAHGISNRLTGGRLQAGCLGNQEQMGEGWSDFFGIVMTIKAGDDRNTLRPMAAYADGSTNGIRTFPYTTNMAVNPHTYNSIKTEVAPHGVGSVWNAMLWDMTWDLIDQYGFDPDLYNGTGGNNIALQLVMDGLKLQPCSPGFVDGRDAILLADENANGGANRCLIWNAFAKRGLGLSATQGSTDSKGDGTEAFDVPTGPNCILAVSDNTLNNNFNIYPNPSNGVINISARVDVGAVNVIIFDINGRKVYNQNVELTSSTTSINASGLKTGLYIVQIKGDDYSQTSKLIIK